MSQKPSSAKSGQTSNPKTGQTSNPKTGQTSNPKTGQTLSCFLQATSRAPLSIQQSLKQPAAETSDPEQVRPQTPKSGQTSDPKIRSDLQPRTGQISNPKSGQTSDPENRSDLILLLAGKKPYATFDTATFETRWRAKSRTPPLIQQPLKQPVAETSNPKIAAA
jgi:hypothetical protein